MPWRPLPSGGIAYAVCTHSFRATQPQDLPLQIGDNVYIIEQGGTNLEWCRGYLVAPPSLLSGLTSERGRHVDHRVFTGIFPRNCVEVREVIGDGKVGTDANGAQAGAEDSINDGDDVGLAERRKSEALNARRLSKAVAKKRSVHDITKRDRVPLVDLSEPLPRDPNGVKPLAPVPLLRMGDETGQAVQEPLVDEIASCLREWHDERLHEMLLSSSEAQFEPISALVTRLDTNRKQLLHDVMTRKELIKLREDTVWDLVAGNKMLQDDIIVRNPTENGRILTADDSVIEMTKLQANMSILDRPPKAAVDRHKHYHVLVDVRNLVVDFDEPAILQMYLCTQTVGQTPEPISETYSISLPIVSEPGEQAVDQPKTLFIDLSGTDIGIGADTTQLYAVFRLLQDQPVRHDFVPPHASSNHQQKSSISSIQSTASGPQKMNSVNKGRRSVFGSQRKKDSSQAGSDPISRPDTGQSMRPSTHSTADSRRAKDTKTVKRTTGVGAIEISKLAQQQTERMARVAFWTPVPSVAEDKTTDAEDWNEVIRNILHSASGAYSRLPLIKRFEVIINAFAEGDLSGLYRNNPTQLFNVHMSPKMGFSGVPTEKRSDIYLTLTQPVIGASASLQHSKFGNVPLIQRCATGLANLQLTLEVRKADGQRIDNCVFAASNHDGHTAWRTTGIEVGESWNQTIRLAVPAEDVQGSHVVMSIADAPSFPFALAWIPLWEADAFVRDGEHQVALYVYDEYSSSMIGGKGAYLALPPWHDKRNEPTVGTSAILSVRTLLCSTEFSQDPTLLGLLNWRNYHGAELIEILERFALVPAIEMVKLLDDIINALFQILDEYVNNEKYEDLVFFNFVILMGVARDRRFNLENVVDPRLTSFNDRPHASQCLIRAYHRLVSNPMDPEASRKLRTTLKIGDQMLRLIVQSRNDRPVSKQSGAVNGETDDDQPDFEHDLQTLFVAVMALMRNPMAILLGTQTLVVQHFHTWLPQLTSIMTPTAIFEIAANLLEACAHARSKLVLHRLVLILNYSQLELFKTAEVRQLLIASTFRWLDRYWGDTANVTNQWRDQVRLCCSIVAAQMAGLGDDSCQYIPKMVTSYAALQKIPRSSKKTFSMLFPSTYPFPVKNAPVEVDVDEAMLELSALLAAALTTQQRLYLDANQIDVPGVLLQALKVEKSVLSGEAFPRSWLSLHVVHHRLAITALDRIFEALVTFLPDSSAPEMSDAIEFDTELWRAYFDTLFLAVSSPALAMEAFPEQKRRAVWKIAGDVRELGADLIRRSWNAIGWETDNDSRELHGFERMGGFQVQFVPDLMSPIVELCLSVHSSLRSVAIEVLRTMIISTWEIDQDLAVVQAAMVDCLDRLSRSNQVSETILQTTFIEEMIAQFRPLQHSMEDSLYNAVVEMFAKIEALLGMLTKVHQGGATNEATRIVDTLMLMEFLRGVQSEDAYIRYVHQLVALQAAAGNYTEAGLALRMHADRYEWNPSLPLPAMETPEMPAQTAFERKEGLYFEMCQHFERGQAWQCALMTYHELALQYAQNTFDYSKLARAQRATATIHEKIARGERINPRYFRVVYKGLGWPMSLRDKDFIFEGLSTDRLNTFEERMQQYHPNATVLHTPNQPSVEGQYLHVYPVSPNKDLGHMVYQRMKVSQAAREYALMSNPQRFTTTSRHPQSDVPITEQVVEKIIYTTAEPFPTLLRRSEVVAIDMVILSPIQAAVERTTRKTQELLALAKRIDSGVDGDLMGRLSDEILLSVDPDSDSSVSRYRSLLPNAEQNDRLSGEATYSMLEKEEEPMDSMQNALNVALLDHTLAIRRCLARFTKSEHLATKAELVPRFEATFERELAILFPHKQGLMDEAAEMPPAELDQAALAMRSPDLGSVTVGAQEERPPTRQEREHRQEQQQPQQNGGSSSRRSSRRRSLPFLRRIASSSTDNLNGTTNGYDSSDMLASGGNSRQRSRSRSRSRISLFRSADRNAEGSSLRSPSQSSRNDRGKGIEEGGLKQRLSFLKAASRSGLSSSGADY